MRVGIRCVVVSLALGGIVGCFVVALSFLVDAAAQVCSTYPWLVWLMPVAGLGTYGLYYVLHLIYSWSTADVMLAAEKEEEIPAQLAPAVFFGTIMTILCGGSVGKEAASLQIGASVGSVMGRWVPERYRPLLVPAAMAAALGSMLNTPALGVVFAFESLRQLPRSFAAVTIPVITSFAAWLISSHAGVCFIAPSISLSEIPLSPPEATLCALIVGVCAGISALAFCLALRGVHQGLAWLGAPVFALAVGGVLTALILGYADLLHYEGVRTYCGTGAEQIATALSGQPMVWWAFAAKALLTILTLAGGFKGGEIMPILAIGACAGVSMSMVVSPICGVSAVALQPVLSAVFMAAFFAGCTNCPVSALVLAFEIFGWNVLPWSAVACVVAYVVARPLSLYPTTLRKWA